MECERDHQRDDAGYHGSWGEIKHNTFIIIVSCMRSNDIIACVEIRYRYPSLRLCLQVKSISMKITSPRNHLLLLATLAALTFAACSVVAPTATPTPVEPSATPTLTPTLTPTPSPRVVLYAPDGADDALRDALKSRLDTLAGDAGMQVDVRPALSAADLTADVRAVVVLAPAANLAELTAAAPQIGFAAFGVEEVQPSANLSVIALGSSDARQQAFLAGYTAALVTVDWRMGVILVNSAPDSPAVQEGFVNGAYYLCNFCNPVYPPYVAYPQIAEMNSPADWQTAADTLIAQGVLTVYVPASASSPDLLTYLNSKGIKMIGSSTPSSDLTANWVASVQGGSADSVLESIWKDLLASKGGANLSAVLGLTDLNPDVLTPGKMAMVNGVISQLSGGWIDPASVPAQ